MTQSTIAQVPRCSRASAALTLLLLAFCGPPRSAAAANDGGFTPDSANFSPRSLPVPSSPGGLLALPSNVYVPGQNLRVTFNDYAQDETGIAADPNDPNVVIGVFKDYGYFQTSRLSGPGVARSNDGGMTFTHLTAPITLPVDFDSLGGDPSIAFDSRGQAYYLFIGAGGPGDPTRGSPPVTHNNGLFVARTTTGGAQWLPLTTVVSNLWDGDEDVPFEDKPYIAVDHHTGSPYRDRAYVSWTRFYPAEHPNGGTCISGLPRVGGGDIMVARSSDGGLDWTSIRLTAADHEPGNTGFCTGAGVGKTLVQGSDIECASNGDVYVVYNFSGPIPAATGARIECLRSVDGGATFSLPTYPFGPANGTSTIPDELPTVAFRTNAFPNVRTDPTRPGYVYVVATDDDDTPTAADDANIFFARSTDDGATWQPRIKLNDDGLSRLQLFPKMAVNERGDIAVIWYDMRNDLNNHLLDIYYTISTDGGVTWSPNARLTDTNFEPNTGQFKANGFFGDYIGLAASGNQFHALWTDTRRPGSTPEQEVYYARLDPSSTTGVGPGTQVAFGIDKPKPNPAPAGFAIRASAPMAGPASLRVCDISGRLVSVLHEGTLEAGERTFRWNGTRAGGRAAESGVYFVIFEAGGRRASERFVLLK